jgi:excisionase family DNA binding protein
MRRKAFAQYVGVGERTVSRWLKMGLPSAKINGGSRLIHVEQADEWIEQFMIKDDSANVNDLVDGIMKELNQ